MIEGDCALWYFISPSTTQNDCGGSISYTDCERWDDCRYNWVGSTGPDSIGQISQKVLHSKDRCIIVRTWKMKVQLHYNEKYYMSKFPKQKFKSIKSN